MAKHSKRRIVVVDAPLLIESDFYKEMDKIIVVKVHRTKELNRCIKLGFSKKEAFKRIKAQMPLRRKLGYADFIIDNNGSKSQTKRRVKEIWNKLNVSNQ